MPRSRCRFVSALLACVFGVLLAGSPLAAQDDTKGEKVRFDTADGVTIKGTFYRSAKNRAPAIILLHNLGEHSRTKVWVSLAEELQKYYSVLTFDFRGHKESTTVEPTEFWKHNINKTYVKGFPKATEIDYLNMKPQYYPAMINDIAAARAFLEGRHDNGDCNISSMILIGAETGATLGAIWLNSESVRYHQPQPPFGPLDKNAEGKDVIAAIWLTPTPKLGSRLVDLPKILDYPGRVQKTPMVFFYAEDDADGKKIAKVCEKSVRGGAKKDDANYRFTAAVQVKDSKLTGSGLLQKSLGTDEAIMEYLEKVVDAKGNPYEAKREFRRNFYVWLMNNQRIPAKLGNEKLLIFDSYERFIVK